MPGRGSFVLTRGVGMRNVDRFYEAFAHTGHEVLGRRLEKFTLRHRFWLSVFESPLVTGGEMGMVDLELAVRLCAIPYAELDVAVPRMVARRPRWGDRLGFFLRSWKRRTDVEYAAMLEYLLDHGCPPATHEGGLEMGVPDGPPPPGGSKAPVESGTIPGILSLVSGLILRTKWSPGIVWGLGPGEAEWYLTGVLLHDGVDVPIKSGSDEEFEEGIRREREAKAAAEAAGVDQELAK